MKRNMGTADRIIRTVFALVVVGLLAAGKLSGILGVVLAVVAVVFLATSAIGYCPAYNLLGTCSCKCDDKECAPKG